MSRKLKTGLVLLGMVAAVLIVTQLTLGLIIANSGSSPDIRRWIKIHQHTGYLTVGVVLVYVVGSVAALVRSPSPAPRPRG